MQRLTFEAMENIKKEKKQVRPPKCWICMDQGMVFYDKKKDGMIYEVAARCRCAKGRQIGESISYVMDVLEEGIADVNFKNFEKTHPKTIKKMLNGKRRNDHGGTMGKGNPSMV